MSRATACVIVLVAVAAGAVPASETDQYLAWEVELADAADALNAFVNADFRRRLDVINRRFDPGEIECEEVVARAVRRMRRLQHFLDAEPSVEVHPPRDASARRYYASSIHGDPTLFPFYMALARTVNVDGVYFGADKYNHFLRTGARKAFKRYRKLRRKGLSHDAALDDVFDRFVFTEVGPLGLGGSGTQSMGDLDANFQGLRFALAFCTGDAHPLRRTEQGWLLAAEIDMRDYVNPRWDESYNNNAYTEGRWRSVRERLQPYCERRHDAEIAARMEGYRRRTVENAMSLHARVAIADGELLDPRRFSLDAACSDLDDARRIAVGEAPRAAASEP